jgi:hypothetical protein
MDENPYEPPTIRSDAPPPKWWHDNPHVENAYFVFLPVVGFAIAIAIAWIAALFTE